TISTFCTSIVPKASSADWPQQLIGPALAASPIVRASVLGLLMGSLIATPTLVAGEPAATVVSLRAQDGHGRVFDLTSLRGRVVAVTFASRYTRDEADRVHAGLLEHAAQGDMLVVNVVDLMGVPGLFHSYARRKAAEHDQAGRIVHVIDEHGDLRRS